MQPDLPSFRKRLFTLFVLYTVQGLPYGFFITVLPLFLREADWSRTAIGYAGLLGSPWVLKPLWAPLVDRFHLSGLGKRKSWILPCMAALPLAALLLAGMEPRPGEPVLFLLLTVFVIIFLTATQDIAVDGFAVDILHRQERGPGNAAQVVGFKLGMLLTGGILLAFSAQLGWSGICWAMAIIVLLGMPVATLYPEERSAGREDARPMQLGEIFRSLLSLLSRPGFPAAILLIATYKLGESGVDAMYKVFLLDRGLSKPEIGMLCGGWGLSFSLAGSLLGGWIGARSERLRSLFRVGILRALPLVAIAALPFIKGRPDPWLLYPITLAEHFVGGMLTPLMFAFMMDMCDRRVGATHFTALAAVELLGKMVMGLNSGFLIERAGLGYGGLFILGAGISLAWPLLVLYVQQKQIDREKDFPSE